MDKANKTMGIVMFMKVVGKKVKSTDMVYIKGRMARSNGVFGRMVNLMAKDGSSFQMELAMAWNMREEK
jgi:hypothetical protein